MPDLAFAFLVIFALGFAIGYGVRENMSRKRHRRFAERGPKKWDQQLVEEAKREANEAAEQQRLATVKAEQEREAEAKRIAALTSQQQPAVGKVLGLDLADLTDELRKKHNIEDRVKGVLIAGVDPNSQASHKRLTPGMVITDVQLYEVPNVTELQQRIDTVKKDGKKTAVLRVTTPDGNQPRFVGFSLE
jgi:serine protease Do